MRLTNCLSRGCRVQVSGGSPNFKMASTGRTQAIADCRKFRAEGRSLNEIVSRTRLPKSTVHWHIRDIKLSSDQKDAIEQKRKELCRLRPNPRKGKCIPGRKVNKPKSWTRDLIHVLSHLMFDGGIERYGCVYYNSSPTSIKHMKRLLERIFGVKTKEKEKDNGVHVLSAYYVELADYVRKKEKDLLEHIKNGASAKEKGIFLKAFFDDEGSIYHKKGKRRIRGSQDSLRILSIVKDLLSDFDIYARIDNAAKAIEISGKKNLLNFKKHINFSQGLFVNPQRKNSVWKRKLEKRDILTEAVNSYSYA